MIDQIARLAPISINGALVIAASAAFGNYLPVVPKSPSHEYALAYGWDMSATPSAGIDVSVTHSTVADREFLSEVTAAYEGLQRSQAELPERISRITAKNIWELMNS